MFKPKCSLMYQKSIIASSLVFLIALMLVATHSIAQTASEFDMDIEKKEPKLFNRGGNGTFGTQLAKRPSFVSINGFADLEYEYNNKGKSTFEQEVVELFVSSQFDEHISTEFDIQFERDASHIDIEYAFLDYKFNNKAILRFGKFYLPTGDFNEYRHKAYINRAVDHPLTTSVSPAEWSDTGIQLRGKLGSDSTQFRPYYAVYMVNGLQGRAGDGMEILENGAFQDNNKSKGYGAQLGTEYKNFFASLSYHSSSYDSASKLKANLTGFNAGFDNGKLYLMAEYHTNQFDPSYASESQNLKGLYVMTAYRYKSIEPTLRWDQNDLAGIKAKRMTYGFNYYLKKSGFLKLNYESENRATETIHWFLAAVVFSF
jgi:Phosphate-selective porin O and P